MMKHIRIPVQGIVHKRVGEELEEYLSDISLASLFHDDAFAEALMSAQVHIKKFDDFLGVQLRDVSAHLPAECGRCQRIYQHIVEDGESEVRKFYVHVPSQFYEEELEDVFTVDTGNNSIDVTEMMRQELLMMLPTATFCEKDDCTSTMGKQEDQTSESDVFQPFANLKDMMREE